MIRHQPPSRLRGFTLLEMLLAISLLVLLTGLAYGTLRIGVRGWEAADVQADHEDALRVGWPFLHQALEAARPEQDTTRNSVRFQGDQQSVSWVGELPAHFATGGPRALTLSIIQDPQQDRRQLQLSSQSLNTELASDETPQHAILVDDLATLEIHYYGPDTDGRANTWQSSWQQRRQLPMLIRIDISPVGTSAWPSLYAHPYLATASTATPVTPNTRNRPQEAE